MDRKYTPMGFWLGLGALVVFCVTAALLVPLALPYRFLGVR